MKVYLDDERTPPNGWVSVRTPVEAIDLLKMGKIKKLSLDHDLGLSGNPESTGYDVLTWLEEQVFCNNFIPPKIIIIHTANPVARKRMEQAVRKIEGCSLVRSKAAGFGPVNTGSNPVTPAKLRNAL